MAALTTSKEKNHSQNSLFEFLLAPSTFWFSNQREYAANSDLSSWSSVLFSFYIKVGKRDGINSISLLASILLFLG